MIASEDFFSKLKNQLKEQLPFVAYRFSAEAEVKALLQKDAKIHEIKDFTESGFVFAPFDAEISTFYIPTEASEAISANFFSSEVKISSSASTYSIFEFQKSKEDHISLVQKGVEAIKEGQFRKVVLSRKEEVELEQPEPIFIFEKLLEKYPTAFVYIWFHPKVGLWLGATPETLLQVERNRFKTMALAGTQKYEGNVDVNWGEKEKEEQEIVTFSILENLKNSGINNIKTSEAYTAKAGNLLHIKTDIEGWLDPDSSTGNIKEIISALHPTPAVCGLPKEAAKWFILKNENYNREFYTGFLGELNVKSEVKRNSNRRNQENQAYASIIKKTALFVNLRCMKIEENKAHLYIGGGITKDSNPQAEWEETVNKSQTMKAVLQ